MQILFIYHYNFYKISTSGEVYAVIITYLNFFSENSLTLLQTLVLKLQIRLPNILPYFNAFIEGMDHTRTINFNNSTTMLWGMFLIKVLSVLLIVLSHNFLFYYLNSFF